MLAGRRPPYLALAGLFVAILAAITALFLTRAQSRAGDWAEHSLRVQVMLTELTDHVRAIESDHRGYILSGNPGIRASFTRQVDAMGPALARLQYEVRDNPTQLNQMEPLRRRIAAKVDFARRGVAAVRAGHRSEEIVRIDEGEGTRRMNAALTVVRRMIAEEERLLNERRKTTDRIVLGLGLVLVATVLLVLIIAALVIRDSGRREREITAARDEAIAAEQALREQLVLRAQMEEKILHLQKMESIGQLTGGIAHDFNNMLAIVIGSLDLARRRLTGDPERLARNIDNAFEGAERAAALTSRLLAFSRQQPLAPITLDINKLVSGMSELLQRTLGEPYRIETVLAGGLWRSFVDPGQLENAVVNLAVNARDAMPNGGRLTIETSNAYLDDEYAKTRPEVVPGQYVMISITDTGSGMTPEIVAKAFDPFFTTKPVGKGTGLGLSQLFGFVKQTGGHVAIYSEPGQGTTVKLYLPRSHGLAIDPHSRQGILETEIPRALAGETILVVEDEQRVRHFSVDALRDLGYVVISAADAAEALKALTTQPTISMLFTDIVMPEMNGRQLADAAVELRPGLPILFTTGYTRNAVIHNGMLDAGVAFLAKPFSLTQLGTKVREVLDGGGINRPV
ncbi:MULTISPECIES: CHASE3 domain-containing protein [unclassified Sphingomonas]|uniref:CHASE3 domain-containing protein n=1 Tax=unclassified Sphingomonas TaxID=196159 RepID=UPI0006FB0AE5|nr:MULTISPECIES: CHASE3 domain-containing protein [unclassified Sphingomonas]KQX19385.1 histidine kinase [Sphingomonas sp. Root1294]KQY65588.1 histidine kinase [Sphingomonas sp. Root50]KRB95111.1 histidine kinase [Sphingomonas sp. Root720]